MRAKQVIVMSEVADSEELLAAFRAGDPTAVERLFDKHRQRLRRMVELRLNRKLWGRVDPSDVVQEALLQAVRGLPEYAEDPRAPAYLWLRSLTQKQLLMVHRHHLATAKRDAGLEVSLAAGSAGVSSASLASLIVEDATSPSAAVANAEQFRLMEELIDGMDEIDREILALRHFEQLGNTEVAELLGIGKTAASQRFFRALTRLRQRMREIGLSDDD